MNEDTANDQELQVERPDANGCLQFASYLLAGAAVLLGISFLLFVLRQISSDDRWRGEVIAYLILQLVVGGILLAIPVVILVIIIRSFQKRTNEKQ